MPIISVLLALIAVGITVWLVNGYITIPKSIQTILNVVLGLIVVGIGLWLINTYIPMAGSIKAILNIVVVLATCVGVLQAVGLWSRVVKLWNDLISGRFHTGPNKIIDPITTPEGR
jgi:predicted membrane protein